MKSVSQKSGVEGRKEKQYVRNSAQQLPYASFQETAEHCRQKWPGVQATVRACMFTCTIIGLHNCFTLT